MHSLFRKYTAVAMWCFANKGVSDSEVFADGNIHFDGTAWYTYDDLAFRSYNVKILRKKRYNYRTCKL